NAPAADPVVKGAELYARFQIIHPFSDGNGRIGRLWQHVILVRFHPLFEYLPIESVIHSKQDEYYRVLGLCDKAGNSSLFVEFSLLAVQESLETFLGELRPEPVTADTRLEVARQAFGREEFSRKNYLSRFPALSTATASRDLRYAVEQNLLEKTGDKALTRYRFR
ncbi:MAG TPA: Fic family protein, partial [Polyangiaceae bacterium]|nr:Fic family protein [Polyangiaceae bacterium]